MKTLHFVNSQNIKRLPFSLVENHAFPV